MKKQWSLTRLGTLVFVALASIVTSAPPAHAQDVAVPCGVASTFAQERSARNAMIQSALGVNPADDVAASDLIVTMTDAAAPTLRVTQQRNGAMLREATVPYIRVHVGQTATGTVSYANDAGQPQQASMTWRPVIARVEGPGGPRAVASLEVTIVGSCENQPFAMSFAHPVATAATTDELLPMIPRLDVAARRYAAGAGQCIDPPIGGNPQGNCGECYNQYNEDLNQAALARRDRDADCAVKYARDFGICMSMCVLGTFNQVATCLFNAQRDYILCLNSSAAIHEAQKTTARFTANACLANRGCPLIP